MPAGVSAVRHFFLPDLGEGLTEPRSSTLARRGAARGALKSHRAIFRAVRARDPEAAEQAMRQHLGEVEALYWKEKEAKARG